MISRAKDMYTLLDERYPAHTRIFRYLLSGGTALGTDLVLLYLFTDVFGIWYLISVIMAFILAFFVSFALQKYWTFGDHSRDNIRMQMGIYFTVAVFNLALNTFLVYSLVEWAGAYYLFAQILASAIIAIESFFIYRHFIFEDQITT